MDRDTLRALIASEQLAALIGRGESPGTSTPLAAARLATAYADALFDALDLTTEEATHGQS